MDASQAKALRAPFPPEVVGKLPKVNCSACTNAAKQASAARDKHCTQHQVTKCRECGNYITTGHIHLDYVGHAAATDRLLQVDPEWTWRPFTTDEISALPPAVRDGGLWIMLTIAGVTRPGFGDAQGKTGPNAVKECIGDAIRNAGMRFGLALDMWAKEDLHAAAEPEPTQHSRDAEPDERPASGPKLASEAQVKAIWTMAHKVPGLLGDDERSSLLDYLTDKCGRLIGSSKELTGTEASRILDNLKEMLP